MKTHHVKVREAAANGPKNRASFHRFHLCGKDTLRLILLIPNKGSDIITSNKAKMRNTQCLSQAWQQSPCSLSWQQAPERRDGCQKKKRKKKQKKQSTKGDKVCCHCIRSSCLVVQLKKYVMSVKVNSSFRLLWDSARVSEMDIHSF